LLALLLRLRGSPDLAHVPEDVEFLRSESRAVYQALGGELPTELAPIARAAARELVVVERLSPSEFRAALEETQLTIKRELLERQRAEINSLGDDAEIRRLLGQLDSLRRGMGEVDQRRSHERESAGSR
jgi:hypothetical protein